MPAPTAKMLTPAAAARLALMRLARTATPPTPENYASAYRQACGLARDLGDSLQPDPCATESAETLLSLVKTIRLTTTELTHGIERFDVDLKTMFSDATQGSPQTLQKLIEELTASRLTLQKSVDESRRELEDSRKQLEQVTAELERSRSLARIDPLTGSVNRRGMEEILEREISRARRIKSPLCLALLDIDHFKRVNDEHGHDIGDQALMHLVAVIKPALRDSDVLCRYGGEEFAIILPDSGRQSSLFVIDQLRTKVEHSRLPASACELQLRFSAGVAEVAHDDDQISLLKRADTALFAAKRAGRNRVYLG